MHIKMDDPTTIRMNELRSLLELRGGKVGPLAAMPPLSFSAKTDIPMDALRSKGLVDPSGQISPSIRPTLEVIAEADSLTQIILSESEGEVTTHIIYYTPDQRSTGLRVDDAGQIAIRSVKELKRYLFPFFSNDHSSATSVAFTYRLIPDDAFVLAALIDLIRMDYNKKKLDGTFESEYPIKTILDALNDLDRIYSHTPDQTDALIKIAPSPDRRISILLSALISYRSQTRNDIQESLARLVTAGLVTTTQTGWVLTPEISTFARNLIRANQATYMGKHSVVEGILETEDMLIIAEGGSYLSFCTRSQTDDQVNLTGYSKLSREAFLGEFFDHPLEALKQTLPELPRPNKIHGNRPKDPLPSTRKRFTWSVGLALILAAVSLCMVVCGCGLVAMSISW